MQNQIIERQTNMEDKASDKEIVEAVSKQQFRV